MKYSQLVGIGAVCLLIGACFLPWAYFPDIQKDFTGFFSEHNAYGKPGKIFIILCSMATFCFIIPRVWAKRANLLVCALNMAFGVKCYLLYGACYRGICPEKRIGLFLMEFAAVLMVAATITPDLKVKENPN